MIVENEYISHCVEFDDKSLEAGSDVLDNIQSISTLILYFISYIPVSASEKGTQIHCLWAVFYSLIYS